MPTWDELTLSALEHLRRPPDRSRFGAFSVAQIMVRWPFENPCCWSICNTLGSDSSSRPVEYDVFFHTWLVSIDYPDPDMIEERYGFLPDTPEFKAVFHQLLPAKPTIRSQEFTVPCAAIDAPLSIIKSCKLPVVIQDILPNDGPSYEVILGNYLSGMSFRWSGNGPAEWRNMIVAVQDCLRILASCAKTPTP